MKLVIFGLTVSSSWGNGHATLWRALLSALAKEGHRCVFFERDRPFYRGHRDLHGSDAFDLVLYESWPEIEERAQHELENADAGIVTSYCADALDATALLFRSHAAKVFYDLDAPMTLDRLERGEMVEYLWPEGLGGFDLVLSYTGGPTLDALRALGARNVHPLYGSVDPEAHRPVAQESDYRCRLSYLGTYAADRQEALQRLFLEPARRMPNARFLLGGAQYPLDFPWSDNVWYQEHVPPPAHPAFFSSSDVTLNVTRGAMAKRGYCPSGRLFEAAACGVPILSDDWPGLAEFFRPEEEILIANDTEDAIAHLLKSAEELTDVAAAARKRVLRDHTATVRAAELVAFVEDAQ